MFSLETQDYGVITMGSKYKVGRGMILPANKKSSCMAVDINNIAPFPGWLDLLFSKLFDLHICATESIRPIHKRGGW